MLTSVVIFNLEVGTNWEKKKKFKPSWDFLDNMLVLTMKQEDVEVRILTEITFVPAR